MKTLRAAFWLLLVVFALMSAATASSLLMPPLLARSSSDFGSLFIEAIVNGTRTAVERYLATAPDGSPLCSQLTLRLDSRLVANYSTLQVLMIDHQRVLMRIRSAPGFCRMRLLVVPAPLPSIRLNLLSKPPPLGDDEAVVDEAATFPSWPPPSPVVVPFNLTTAGDTPQTQFDCELVGEFLGYANVVVQLQQNATTWHDMYRFRISIARAQPVLHFVLQQSAICVLFVANFALGLQTDFGLFRSALRKTLPGAVFIALLAKLVVVPLVCYCLFRVCTFEPDLATAGLFATAFSPCGLEALLHCLLLVSPGAGHEDDHQRQHVAAVGVSSGLASTTALVLASFGWLPLGVYAGRLLDLPVSLIEDAGDKFLFFEAAPPGFEVAPYAAVAISFGCLLVPFCIGTVIRGRWQKVASHLQGWFIGIVFAALLQIAFASAYSNLLHVVRYMTLSTVIGAVAVTYSAGLFAALVGLCFRQSKETIVAVAVVVSCPNVTIALHLIQANLEPPATDLSAILPAVAALVVQLPLFIVEICRAIVLYHRNRRNQLGKTARNGDDTPQSPPFSPQSSSQPGGNGVVASPAGELSSSSSSSSSSRSSTSSSTSSSGTTVNCISTTSTTQKSSQQTDSRKKTVQRNDVASSDGQPQTVGSPPEQRRLSNKQRQRRRRVRCVERQQASSDTEDTEDARSHQQLMSSSSKRTTSGRRNVLSASSDDDGGSGELGETSSPAVVRFHSLYSSNSASSIPTPHLGEAGRHRGRTSNRNYGPFSTIDHRSSRQREQERCLMNGGNHAAKQRYVHFNENYSGIVVDSMRDWNRFTSATSPLSPLVLPSLSSTPSAPAHSSSSSGGAANKHHHGGTTTERHNSHNHSLSTSNSVIPVVLETVV